MLGFRPNSALPVSDIYTIPKGVVTQAVTGVQGVFGPIPTINGSAQIKIYEIIGVEASCTLQMISDLYLMSKHRHMYARPGNVGTLALGSLSSTIKAIVSIPATSEATGQIGNVIAQGTFVFPDGVQAAAQLSDEVEGDRFDYWKKITPTGNAQWSQIVVPKPTL